MAKPPRSAACFAESMQCRWRNQAGKRLGLAPSLQLGRRDRFAGAHALAQKADVVIAVGTRLGFHCRRTPVRPATAEHQCQRGRRHEVAGHADVDRRPAGAGCLVAKACRTGVPAPALRIGMEQANSWRATVDRSPARGGKRQPCRMTARWWRSPASASTHRARYRVCAASTLPPS